ncbi:hypothetical protein J2S15_002268 [Breznakia pachnodae]|uniref:Uncharacterized protein n=1 Tax=Breznakia pachnodae TaxID=265178 RepID=A0ABU0E3P5_9FIRM|nr:hypothetical protein [Breznakia pachnodae]
MDFSNFFVFFVTIIILLFIFLTKNKALSILFNDILSNKYSIIVILIVLIITLLASQIVNNIFNYKFLSVINIIMIFFVLTNNYNHWDNHIGLNKIKVLINSLVKMFIIDAYMIFFEVLFSQRFNILVSTILSIIVSILLSFKVVYYFLPDLPSMKKSSEPVESFDWIPYFVNNTLFYISFIVVFFTYNSFSFTFQNFFVIISSIVALLYDLYKIFVPKIMNNLTNMKKLYIICFFISFDYKNYNGFYNYFIKPFLIDNLIISIIIIVCVIIFRYTDSIIKWYARKTYNK